MMVWRRLTLFHRNVGVFTSATFATVAVLVTVAGVQAIVAGRYLEPILVFWPMVAVSWLVRWTLFGVMLKHGGVLRPVAVLVGLAYIFRPKSGWFPGDEWLMISVIALYFGLIFWWHSGSLSLILTGAAIAPPETDDREDENNEDRSGPDPRVIRHAGDGRSAR
jgi:hypothetical protein